MSSESSNTQPPLPDLIDRKDRSNSSQSSDTDERQVHPLRDAFLGAMGRTAAGVSVVTTNGLAGKFGQTVSAMCSVSADPPMVLICVHARSPLNDAIIANRVFCVNVLATQHDHVADTFAGRPWPGKDRWDFTCGRWNDTSSLSPRLDDALASFDCEIHEIVRAGTHRVLLGHVVAITTSEGTPLLYSRQFYQRPEVQEPSIFEDFPDARPNYLTTETYE